VPFARTSITRVPIQPQVIARGPIVFHKIQVTLLLYSYNILLMRLTAMLLPLILITSAMAGCLDSDGEDSGEISVVGIYVVDTIGTATANNDDILLEITLVSSDFTIKFVGSDEHKRCVELIEEPGECKEWFGFELGVGCVLQKYDGGCIIIEEVDDDIWSIGETIVLRENSNICDSPCVLELTIENGVNNPRDHISINTETESAEYAIN